MKHILALLVLLAPSYASDDDPDIVEYVEDGAIIIEPGYVKLNNPPPLSFQIKGLSECLGELLICYKSAKDDTTQYGNCDPGYCPVYINYEKELALAFKTQQYGDTFWFTLKYDDYYACPPQYSKGYHQWHFYKLPSGCDVKVIGATRPKEMAMANLVICLLIGATVAIILVSIGAVLYCHYHYKSKNEKVKQAKAVPPAPDVL